MRNSPRFLHQAWICLALGLVTLSLYLPSLRHDFIAYDDQQYVYENFHVQGGLTLAGLQWAFGYHAGNWHPLTWLSHMLDCQLFGLHPAGHHSVSVLLHAINTALVFLLLNRLINFWCAVWIAAVFGWHPLHVESVAWIAERKDLLCAFFFLLTLLAYVRYTRDPQASKRWYAGALLGFVLALMSKPMAVTLPFVLFLLDAWPLNRFRVNDFTKKLGGGKLVSLVVEKLPFLFLSACACLLTLQAQEIAIVSTAGLSATQRILHSGVAYMHYVTATFWPRALAVYYPYELGTASALASIAFVFLLLATWFSIYRFRRDPWLLTGWFWFIGMLVPVIGLIQVGDQAWADRYMYLPLIGLLIITAELGVRTLNNSKALGVVAIVSVLILAFVTSFQLRHWRNTQTLFTHANAVVPNNYMAITMLGMLMAQEGRLDEAIAQYQKALRLKPELPQAHFFLGNALDQQGRLDEAIAEYQQALWFRPIKEATHVLLGTALGKKNLLDEAAHHYFAALQLNPESAVAHNNLARVLHTQGRLEEAIDHYFAALKLDPQLAKARNNLGVLLLQKGKIAEGVIQLRAASNLNPTNVETRLNLALALNQEGHWAESVVEFAQVVRTINDPNAHFQYGVALLHVGKTREALSQYALALLARPDFPEALNGLSWELSTSQDPAIRNGNEAIRMAQRACELTGQGDPTMLKTLAAAYGEVGNFPEAIAAAEKALAESKSKDLADELTAMLVTFKSSQPWRGKK